MASNINNRFGRLEEQFTNYKSDVEKYRQYLKKVTNKRLDDRYKDSSDSNSHAKSQREMMDKINSYSTSISSMASVVKDNHLIEQIKNYDK